MAEKKEKPYIIENTQLMAEWDWDKNNALGFDPSKITPGSEKKAWWKCEKGHEWQAKIYNRTKGSGCPQCQRLKFGSAHVQVLVNKRGSLLTTNPTLASQWHPTKNGSLSPQDVTENSTRKIWWICNNGHEWQATINSRNFGSGCPYCSGQVAISGVNDLKTVNPTLAKEWNNKKNGRLKPSNVLPNSNKKVWWKCKEGHEWQAIIKDRSNGRGCPICTNRKILAGYNDLATTHPLLADQWNYVKNGDLKPTELSAGSGKKVWWVCPKCGYEWQATINNRSNGTGCPNCARVNMTKMENYLK